MKGILRVGWFVFAVMLLMGLAVSSAAEDATSTIEDDEEPEEGVEILYHQLGQGETIGSVAMDYEVNIMDLKSWNGLESVHDVGTDDELEIRLDEEARNPTGPLPVVHVVSPGDTLEDIAIEYGVRLAQVRQWNRNVDPRRLQIGQQIQLHVPGSDGHPVSWGQANSGRLYNGVAMESSPGLRVRNMARSYGTQHTINLLQAAAADVQARWPDAPELVVGSLSLRNGGPMSPHRSHQSGRDADVTYYHRGNVELPDFRNMTAETFDAVKNWHMFKTLIDTDEVEYIFVDYTLQEVLYEYALSIGYNEDDLVGLIQYPRGRRSSGIIRHARGHRNHFHLRIKCADTDQNCR